MLIGGASYHANGWNIGVSNYWINDALNTAYGEIDYLFSLGGGDDGPSFRAGINTLDQRTVGDDLIEGAPYNTYQASARFIASYWGLSSPGRSPMSATRRTSKSRSASARRIRR